MALLGPACLGPLHRDLLFSLSPIRILIYSSAPGVLLLLIPLAREMGSFSDFRPSHKILNGGATSTASVQRKVQG